MLPTAVEQLEPPPQLRERLMATVRAEAAAAGGPPARPGRRSPHACTRGARVAGTAVRAPAPALALGALLLAVAAGALGYAVGTGGDGDETTTVQAEVAPPGARATLERDGDQGHPAGVGAAAAHATASTRCGSRAASRCARPASSRWTAAGAGRPRSRTASRTPTR